MEKPTLSNKVFTENPLLDEIVYNARQLAVGCILKDEDKANYYETAESIHNGDVLIAIERGNVKFSNFKYDYDFLKSLDLFSDSDCKVYADDNTLIPEAYRNQLRDKAASLFVENYVEYNNYYRMLHGEPFYDETGIYEGLWIDYNKISDSSPTSMDSISKMYKEEYEEDSDGNKVLVSDYRLIHTLDDATKNVLYDNGTCEQIIKASSYIDEWEFTQDDVLYVMHIGDREVGYYDARVAEKFALLYCPPCDAEEVKRRFKDLFEANRLYMLYTIYSDAYKLRSDYYDNFMMIFLIIQTIIDMIVELPEYIIRRDIFDTRTCKYIFESNGVKYFKDIPLKYQVSLVKNLNKLIKFKSTDKCIVDIISIFGVENIQVFKYYIMRDRNAEIVQEVGEEAEYYYLNNTKTVVGQDGDVYTKDDNDSNYDLKFIKVPLQEKYDDYIRTESNIYDYDTMVEADAYWNGDQNYDTVKSDVKDLDFTILRSKYYSIEAVIDLAKRNFTMVYFMNMLMYHGIDESSLVVNIPTISNTRKFELMDIICTLFSLSYIYYGVDDTILDTRSKAAQIMGFNMDADLSKISSWLDENHYGLHLKDLHVDTFQVPENGKIMSFNQLQDMFFTNKDCYDHILAVMTDPPSKEIYDAYRYLYKALLTTDRNMEYFLIGDNPVVDQYKAAGFKRKFISIPKEIEHYCPNCHALVDPDLAASGDSYMCPVCKKVISHVAEEKYTNVEDYKRDYQWMLDDMDEETLYFVIRNDFDTSHMYDLYIKKDGNLENVGTARMAYTYREFLRYKDSTLYTFLTNIVNIRSADSRQESCVNAIQSITSFLKDYIEQDGDDAIPLDTVFSGLPSISLDFIKKYVEEVIDFFKSFKIFTHGSSIIYTIDSKFDNYVQLIDHILLHYLFDKSEIIKIEDYLEGKATLKSGFLLNNGPGIGVSLDVKEKHELIDKVWFSIFSWIQRNYSEYYNSEQYQQTEKVIREYIERFDLYEWSDSAFESKYIEELQDYAVDAILKLIVSLYKEDKFEVKEDIHTSQSKVIDEYYNEWLQDIALYMVSIEMSDGMKYQDDYTRNDFYDFYTKYDITDARQSIGTIMSKSEECSLFDVINMITTQSFPAHAFDE